MKKLLLILFLSLLTIPAFAQELDADVTINVDQITNKYKEKLAGFANQVQNYLNTNRFTDSEWEGEKIGCTFNIFFLSAASEVSYSAQVVITSNRPIYKSSTNSLMLKLMDKNWKFDFETNQALIFDLNTFDALTSFLDFYALLIIGVDSDSFDAFGGTPFYSKAIEIALLGTTSKYSSAGWQIVSSSYNRRVFVNELIDSKLQQFREDFFNYHYNGLDLLNSGEKYKLTGQENIAKLIRNLADNKTITPTNNTVLKIFFDTKSGEIVNVLKDYKDKEIFRDLLKIDPGNTEKYLNILEN